MFSFFCSISILYLLRGAFGIASLTTIQQEFLTRNTYCLPPMNCACRGLHLHRWSQTTGKDSLQVQSSTQMDIPFDDTTGMLTITERTETLTINMGGNLNLRDCGRT